MQEEFIQSALCLSSLSLGTSESTTGGFVVFRACFHLHTTFTSAAWTFFFDGLQVRTLAEHRS